MSEANPAGEATPHEGGSPLVSLAFSNAGHFLTHMFMLLYPTVVLSLGDVFSLSYGRLLSLSVPGFILFGAAALPAGWLGDRWGVRGMMALFYFGTGGAAILTGLAPSPLWLAVGLGLIGLFAAIYHPVGIAWLVGVARRRGKALGVNGVFGNLGIAFAASIAGGLATLVHWRAAFIVPGVVSVLVGVAFLLLVRDTSKGRTGKESPHVALSRRDLWRVVAVLSVTFACGGLVFQTTSVALPKLFDDRLSGLAQSVLGVGGFVTMVYGLGSMAQLLVGALLDRVALRTVYASVYLLQVPVLASAVYLFDLPLLVIAQVSVFLAMGAIPITDMLVAHYTPAELRGTVYGAKFVLSLGVASLGVPLVGFVRDSTGGFSALLALLAVMAGVVTVAVLFLPRERNTAPVGAPAAAGD